MKDKLIKNARLNVGRYIANIDGMPFSSKTALSRARGFICGHENRIPQDGDYTIVMADGTCKKKNGEYPITRYCFYNGKWIFQYIVGYPQDTEEDKQ